jgi:hypothetical protein
MYTMKATEANEAAAGVEDADLAGRRGQSTKNAGSHTGRLTELMQTSGRSTTFGTAENDFRNDFGAVPPIA